MNIGNLYTVKKWFWLLFPTKETIIAMRPITVLDFGLASRYPADTNLDAATDAPAAAARHPAAAAWYSKRCNCEVTYFCLDSIVVFLEDDGELKKVLTSDGKIGWTWFNESYNDCFEEMKAKS